MASFYILISAVLSVIAAFRPLVIANRTLPAQGPWWLPNGQISGYLLFWGGVVPVLIAHYVAKDTKGRIWVGPFAIHRYLLVPMVINAVIPFLQKARYYKYDYAWINTSFGKERVLLEVSFADGAFFAWGALVCLLLSSYVRGQPPTVKTQI